MEVRFLSQILVESVRYIPQKYSRTSFKFGRIPSLVWKIKIKLVTFNNLLDPTELHHMTINSLGNVV